MQRSEIQDLDRWSVPGLRGACHRARIRATRWLHPGYGAILKNRDRGLSFRGGRRHATTRLHRASRRRGGDLAVRHPRARARQVHRCAPEGQACLRENFSSRRSGPVELHHPSYSDAREGRSPEHGRMAGDRCGDQTASRAEGFRQQDFFQPFSPANGDHPATIISFGAMAPGRCCRLKKMPHMEVGALKGINTLTPLP
jgi:hypothetical protein